jgi:PTS hybrid protein
MLALLILSHSQDVARGVKEICLQMAPEDVVIEAIGGTKEGGLGIDAMKVLTTMEELLNKSDGVIVVGDIGSTILAAKNALNLCSAPSRVRLADSPLVEGSIVAAVEAHLGSQLDEVLKKAEEAKVINKL